MNKQMSNIWIWFSITLLLIGLFIIIYGSYDLYHNINDYIIVHNNIKNK
jgi:hypothetical protein